jgi:hypothetical protein
MTKLASTLCRRMGTLTVIRQYCIACRILTLQCVHSADVALFVAKSQFRVNQNVKSIMLPEPAVEDSGDWNSRITYIEAAPINSGRSPARNSRPNTRHLTSTHARNE